MTLIARILYLFDPLCGWCYGASDKVAQLATRPGFSITPMPTGLFSGRAAPQMNDAFAAHAWANDQRIVQLTGQVFSKAYRTLVLGDRRTPMDSGPATLALSAVAMAGPDSELRALRAIQTARYVEARDITSAAVLADILREQALTDAADLFKTAPAALMDMHRNRIGAARTLMQRLGAHGVPAFVIDDARGPRLIPSASVHADADPFAAFATS